MFSVNMVLGAGVVGLPYAFYHAGAWLSLAIMVGATLMSSATMGYIGAYLIGKELQIENFLAMKFTAQMLYCF